MSLTNGVEMTKPHPEQRGEPRFDHFSPLQVKDLKSGEIYKARMLNYSSSGIYFESNVELQRGYKIYICIQKSPYDQSTGILKYFYGEVIWRKELIRSSSNYGYGIHLKSISDTQDSVTNHLNGVKYPRKHCRKPFFRSIRFSTDHEIREGKTKDISASGILIVTEEKLKIGQIIRLNLPPKKGKTAEIIGQIVWLNAEGFGLEFKKVK